MVDLHPNKGLLLLCRDVSHELLDKARGASKALEACLATLSDGVDNDAVREALGMDATTIMNDHRMDDDAAASSALQKVLCKPLHCAQKEFVVTQESSCPPVCSCQDIFLGRTLKCISLGGHSGIRRPKQLLWSLSAVNW